ncbi:MFS transporter [Haloferula chungangensis]|uniref:MFS transporter n=1 Tax=Haloferula chungangensis TaxID=1048331 RepID=A0ABW2L8Z4_9BACT
MPDPSEAAEDYSQQPRTFRLELARALPMGFVETAFSTFAVFIAIRIFELPTWMKASIIASGSAGLLLSLFIVQFVRRHGYSVNNMVAGLWSITTIGFVIAALSRTNGTLFFVGSCLAYLTLASASPLMAQIYRKHFSNENRGHLFSLAALARACVGALCGWLGGLWIETQGFPPLFSAYAIGTLLMVICVRSMAPVYLRKSNRIRWFDAFSHVRENAPFRKLLIVWMLLGLGNLIGWSLFVEYISNPRYGFDFEADKVGLITSTIPMIAFIVCVVPWGSIFDRMPFYRVRATVNLFFLAGILVYYLGGNMAGLCIGIAIHGIARAGGNIIWSLWTTRFAPADKVIEYQSVHSFLTGVRGVLAPLIAFTAANYLGPHWVAWASALLIIIATLITWPELKAETAKQAS